MIIGLTPLLIIALSTPPTTIHPHHHQEATMASNGNGGGTNNTNHGAGGSRGRTPAISYPIRHPNQPNGYNTTRNRIGLDANHPIIEHTNRPGQLR